MLERLMRAAGITRDDAPRHDLDDVLTDNAIDPASLTDDTTPATEPEPTPDTDDELQLRPNRADYRRQGHRRNTLAAGRAARLPRTRSAAHTGILTDAVSSADLAAVARLDAAYAANEALPDDEQAPWIMPSVEQQYRDRKATRKRQRKARRATRARR